MRIVVLLLSANSLALGCSLNSQSSNNRSHIAKASPSNDVGSNHSEGCVNETGIENFVKNQHDFRLTDEETDCEEVANSAAFGLVSGMTSPNSFRSSDPSCQSFSLGGGTIKAVWSVCRRFLGYTDDLPPPPKTTCCAAAGHSAASHYR